MGKLAKPYQLLIGDNGHKTHLGKLGQVETMGLVIIVVLIVMLGTFFLAFSLKSEVSSDDRVFLGTKAGNLANALKSVGAGDMFVAYCNGDDSAEDSLSELVFSGSSMIDEDVSVLFTCYDGRSLSYGSCSTGIASENIVLASGHKFFVRICLK
jgi:hypothetical protein